MRVVSGKMRCNAKSGEWEVVQPDVVAPLDRLDSVLVVEPQYRLTHGLSMKRVKDAIQKALAHVTQLQEELQRPPFLDWINECKVLSSGEQPLLGK
jgi:RecG-like helicase